MSFGSCQVILKDHLGLRRFVSRVVPRNWNLFQKQQRVEVAREMLSQGDSFLKWIITGDETCICAFDTETAQQASEWRCVVHYEFLPTGQTVNKDYYLSVMRRLREAIRQKRPEM
ncbi:hypothetical protein AVEN_216456-1 [Araneus ventricosus]|uniref:Uncharacterized protein n=1 Tax=Araneus ventricosus TaxID=182803 RepID=A0A4Y2BLH8_ARAVE|nr:hypothetical protein AVEN_216456-1 [Araneus ventricosus]